MIMKCQIVHVAIIAIICGVLHESFAAETPKCLRPGYESLPCEHYSDCPALHHLVLNEPDVPSLMIQEYVASMRCSGPGNVNCCPSKEMLEVDIGPLRIIKANVPQYPKPLNATLPHISSHKNIRLINIEKCGNAPEIRIINGNKTDPGDYPWMALLQYEDKENKNAPRAFRCGGSLISPYYVLTAAHCIKSNVHKLVAVRLGEHDVAKAEDLKPNALQPFTVQDIEVEKAIAYPHYDKQKRLNDIGLVRLKSPADLEKPNINVICLPAEGESQFELLDNIDPLIKNNLIIAGWGKTENRTESEVMLKAKVAYISKESCAEKMLSIDIFDQFICAGDPDGKKVDTCKGDSGGPIFAPSIINGKNKMVLYGVVSSGVGCENQQDIFPGIYIHVEYYIKWILDNMESE